jgi:hypothetical protein
MEARLLVKAKSNEPLTIIMMAENLVLRRLLHVQRLKELHPQRPAPKVKQKIIDGPFQNGADNAGRGT